MYFDSIQELFYMAGHGVFVWSCYAIVFVALLALTIYPIRKKQKALFAIKQRKLIQQESRRGNE